MLSKKHYETIASIIKDNTLNDDVLNETYIDKEAFINDLTSYFKSDNNGGVLVIQTNNNTGTGSITIDNISLKQLSGNNGTLV